MNHQKQSIEIIDDGKFDGASVYSGRNDVELKQLTAVNVENVGAGSLTPEHREYLLQRHGTLALDPMPSADPADPYNWPQWKVSQSILPVVA